MNFCRFGTCGGPKTCPCEVCICNAGYQLDKTFLWDQTCSQPNASLEGFSIVFSIGFIAGLLVLSMVYKGAVGSPKLEIWRSGFTSLFLYEAFVLALLFQSGMNVVSAIFWGLANISLFCWSYFVLLSILVPLYTVKHRVYHKIHTQIFIISLSFVYLISSLVLAIEATRNDFSSFNAAGVALLFVHFCTHATIFSYMIFSISQLLAHMKVQLSQTNDQGYTAQEERAKMTILARKLQFTRIAFAILLIGQSSVLVWIGIYLGSDCSPYMFITNFILLFLLSPMVLVFVTFLISNKMELAPKRTAPPRLSFTSPTNSVPIHVQIRRTVSLSEQDATKPVS